MMTVRHLFSCLMLAALLLTGSAAGAAYPSRPITLILPFSPGNATDTAGRAIAAYLQQKYRITLLVISRPGGSGVPAMMDVVRAKPDGYTLGLTSANVMTVLPQYRDCGFTYHDVRAVARVNISPMAWGVHVDSGIVGIADLMEKARAEPGRYTVASPGAFTAQRFYHETLMRTFPGVDLPYVAYNGAADVLGALLDRQVSVGFIPAASFNAYPKTLKVLGVCGASRLAEFPDAPTFTELFGKGFVFDAVYGVVAPLNTPDDRVERMQQLIREALHDPGVQASFANAGMSCNYASGAEFAHDLAYYHALFAQSIHNATF